MPVRALQEFLRVLGQSEGDAMIYLGENQILFVYQDSEVISRLIDGQYPHYEQIIPEQHETSIGLATEDFLKAVRAASLFSRPGMNDLTLIATPSEKRLTLKAANSQLGENIQEVEAGIEGKENSIVFNSRYLLDGLTNLRADKTVLQLSNSASPGVLRPKPEKDYLYIIMPIKQ